MEQLIKTGTPKYCNRVQKGDRHDKSVEYMLSQYPDTDFLITPSGDGHLMSVVTVVPVEEPKVEVEDDTNVERISRTRSETQKGSRRKGPRRNK